MNDLKSTRSDVPNPSSRASCPICLAKGAVFFSEGHDRLLGLAIGRFSLYRCRSCRCIFQDPMPRESVLSTYYAQGYWGAAQPGSAGAAQGILDRIEQAYRECVAADHVRFLERCARRAGGGERLLLDIGCGSGLFLNLARRRGFVCRGMDASGKAVTLAQQQYGLQVRQGAIGAEDWNGIRFDFITMFHVLEHLPDPRVALKYVRGLLKPNGSFIVQVPNLSSLQARCFRSRWYGLDVPRHVINFSPEALDLLLREAEFKIHEVARFSLRDNPASIASSLAPSLDPIGRKGRGMNPGPMKRAVMEFAYFALVALCLPFALLESALGFGGTLWVCARRTGTSE